MLTSQQLASARALVDHPAVGAEMRSLLNKHRLAELVMAEAKSPRTGGAMEIAGKSWKQVLMAKSAYHSQLAKDGADLAARRISEREARATQAATARKVYEERLRYAQEQLLTFESELAKKESQWEAHFDDLVEKSLARSRAAEAAMLTAKAAVDAAGDAADKPITEAEAASFGKAAALDVDHPMLDTSPAGALAAAAASAALAAARPVALVPYTPPPKLAAPATDEERERLLKAKIIVHHWHQQDEDLPLSFADLGLQPREVAILVGKAVWERHYSSGITPEANQLLGRGLVGAISGALTALEVDTAAVIARAQAAAETAMASVEAAAKKSRTCADAADDGNL